MDPDTTFKFIFRLMLFCIFVHVVVYFWVISQNDLIWCSRKITIDDFESSYLRPPFKYNNWNHNWKGKEKFWCGL